jgi:response regulator RpfG family c-di-GMP phosphodiesterase
MRAPTQILAAPAGEPPPAAAGCSSAGSLLRSLDVHRFNGAAGGGPGEIPDGPAGFVPYLLSSFLVLPEDWETLPCAVREELRQCPDRQKVLDTLVDHQLLTPYQAGRIAAGTPFGLVLGNYRVLDRLGAGGMGVVFKAEHVDMRSLVAIKVFALTPDTDPMLVSRFLVEMRTVAQLKHPNIVAAVDAGRVMGPHAGTPAVRYFVMEYVPGQDLEAYVQRRGPLAIAEACDLGHQVASALAEVHKFHLVHRDIKPSNVLVTAQGLAKLLDFGLARHFTQRMTEPGVALGTLDYIAPEQARDAAAVDIRADIFSLGGTLFWCLTGRVPFPAKGNIAEDLARRLTQPPPSARALRAEVPVELDAAVAKMMAVDPAQRYQTPEALMRGLLPFLRPASRERFVWASESPAEAAPAVPPAEGTPGRAQRVLIVDDDPGIRALCRSVLQGEGVACDEAANGFEAVEAARDRAYDLVLLDEEMPVMSGMDALRKLREAPPCPHLKVVMISGKSSGDDMARTLVAGADDFLNKPFSVAQFQGRVKAALRLKEAQDRSELLTRHLFAVNAEQERMLTARDSDLVHARNALVLTLAKLVEHRDNETGAHLVRLQRYCRVLAEEAAAAPEFAGQIDPHFIEMLECCAPLHDIGKLGLPDHILLKPGKLTPDERVLMQTHTTIGADTLQEVAKQHGFARVFLQMAIDITRHHHERYDGRGYPDGLAGSAIPLAARIVALADVYDALRSRRVYKPALSHGATVQMMTEASDGHFDPALAQVFRRCTPRLEKIFQEFAD